jgi:hypothetical protein
VCIFLVDSACVWNDAGEQYADVDPEIETADTPLLDQKLRMVS